MEYRIEEKEAFKIIGLKDTFKYETAYQDVPKIWKKFFMKSAFNKINAKYGINIDTNMGCDAYSLIIDIYIKMWYYNTVIFYVAMCH